jgi:hypothetical protein
VRVTLTESGRVLPSEISAVRLALLREEVDALDPDDRAALDRTSAANAHRAAGRSVGRVGR